MYIIVIFVVFVIYIYSGYNPFVDKNGAIVKDSINLTNNIFFYLSINISSQ